MLKLWRYINSQCFHFVVFSGHTILISHPMLPWKLPLFFTSLLLIQLCPVPEILSIMVTTDSRCRTLQKVTRDRSIHGPWMGQRAAPLHLGGHWVNNSTKRAWGGSKTAGWDRFSASQNKILHKFPNWSISAPCLSMITQKCCFSCTDSINWGNFQLTTLTMCTPNKFDLNKNKCSYMVLVYNCSPDSIIEFILSSKRWLKRWINCQNYS